MSTTDHADLRPCPFCGNHPIVRRTMQEYPADADGPAGEYEAWVSICCDDCGIEIIEEYRSDAVERWNRRINVYAAAPDMLEVLRPLADELGFAEWASPEHAEEILRGLISKFYVSALSALNKAEGK